MGSPNTYNARFAESSGNILKDPGSSGTIKVDQRFFSHCQLVTGASGETRTLDDPAYAGQQLTLSQKTHGGGTAVVTGSSPINSAGNTIATFSAIGQLVKFEGVEDGADNLEWRVIVADGAALS